MAETYFVAALYAAVTVGFILMNDSADGKGDLGRRKGKPIAVFLNDTPSKK